MLCSVWCSDKTYVRKKKYIQEMWHYNLHILMQTFLLEHAVEVNNNMESSCEENMISNTKLKGITSTKFGDTYLWTTGARRQ